MTHVIEPAVPDDASRLGPLLLRAWLQTYPRREAGIDEEWIREHRGAAATPEGIARWRDFIEAALRDPDLLFCRVVRSEAETEAEVGAESGAPVEAVKEIVGVLCGRRGEEVTLGPMYLLNHVQGQGLGDRLMAEFLDWAGAARMCLWVTEYNEGAVRFYRRHGFEPTGDRELWQGRLPNLRMAREAAAPVGDG
ncbi:GNAT family N-acetyltransferase [Streptomyces hydrogenans]|uniref:GNAT family N-acetyltransferase n=1 Tax=Streptomyces hydrogenans TaxID=1873719 RepID=UPI00341DC444